MMLDLKSLVAVVTAVVGGAVYAEQTYMKQVAAEQQFRQLRLDALYRDEAECDREAAKYGRAVKPGERGEPESAYCQRVRREIERLKRLENQ